MNALLTEPVVQKRTMGFSMILVSSGSDFLETTTFISEHFFQHFIQFVVFFTCIALLIL